MHTPDRRAVIAALINNDPELLRLATSSATFARGLDEIVNVAATAVAGLAAHAVEVDAQIDASMRAALAGTPFEEARADLGLPEEDDTARSVRLARAAALHDGHGDEGRCRSIAIYDGYGIRCTRPRGHNDGVTGTPVHAHADRVGLTWHDDEAAGHA